MATIKKISGVASTSSPTSEYRLLVESPDGTLMSTTVGDLPGGSGPGGSGTTYTFETGTTNGAFTVTPAEGTAQTVVICGLRDAAYRGVDTSPTSGSTNVITSGGVYTVIGDINTILDNINGEVV